MMKVMDALRMMTEDGLDSLYHSAHRNFSL